MSEKGDRSHWVQNIRADSAIQFRLDDITYRGVGGFPDDRDLLAAVKAKMDAKYGWSDGLVVALSPESETKPA